MTFGEKIGLLRKQLKLSQEDLSKKVGTSAAVIGRYERDEITPSIDVAAKIADALGVMIDYLAGNTSIKLFDKKILQRLEEIELLPEEEKAKVYELIDMALTYNKTKKTFRS